MFSFFEERSSSENFRDAAFGACGGARNGVTGGFILGSLNISTITASSLMFTAGAYAIGGMLSTCFAMLILSELAERTSIAEQCRDNALLGKVVGATACAATAFSAGCIGAAILGLSIVSGGLATLAGALVFALSMALQDMIKCISPEEDDKNYPAMEIGMLG